MAKDILRKLTEEEKKKITLVFNDMFFKDFPDEPTEFDNLWKQSLEEFIAIIYPEEDEPSEIENLLEMCEKYINGDKISTLNFQLGFAMAYDLWSRNESPTFPTRPNPKWEKWEKLKDKIMKLIKRHNCT